MPSLPRRVRAGFSFPALVLFLLAVVAGVLAGSPVIRLDPADAWGHEGFYPPEPDASGSFRWSRPRAVIHFRGLDRSAGVHLELNARGWRPPQQPPPSLVAETDEQEIWRRQMAGDWEVVRIGTGPDERHHLDLLLDVQPFQPSEAVPGSDDRRVLGLQLRAVRLEVPTRRWLWIALSTSVAAVAWALLGMMGFLTRIRFCWSVAATIAVVWIGLATARPYLLDSLPAGSVPFLRVLGLGLLLGPVLLRSRLSAGKRPLRRWAALLTLAACIFVVYAPALRNGFFWDDFDFARPISLSEWLFTFYGTWNWTGVGNDYYRPLIVTLFQIDYLLYGLRPAGFHLTNIFLHVLNSYLVAHFLSFWVRPRWALAGATFFALHPMAATGLAWISERTDVLCTTFFLLTLLAVASYLRRPKETGLGRIGLAYAGALASKEVAITFPAVALGYAACRNRLNRRTLRMMSLLVAVSALYAIGWVVLFHQKLGGVNITTVAAEASAAQIWHSLLRLLALALWPRYYPSYDFEFLAGESVAYLYGGSALFLLTGFAILAWGHRREKRLFLFATIWLLVTVLPLFNIRYPDYIRLGYLPAVACGLAAAGALSFISRRIRVAGPSMATALLILSLARMAPSDLLIVRDWAHFGRIAEMINRDKAASPAWLERIGPERRGIFESQRERALWDEEHVEELLAGQRRDDFTSRPNR